MLRSAIQHGDTDGHAASTHQHNATSLFAYPQVAGLTDQCANMTLTPLRCDHPSYQRPSCHFAVPPGGCDWSTQVGGCHTGVLDWSQLRRKRFYFLGNSVTRHYAYGLGDLLRHGKDLHLNRTIEQQLAGRKAGGLSSPTASIRFLWKNWIGPEGPVCKPGAVCRDACRYSTAAAKDTRLCLSFLLRDATVNDVLVVGASSLNLSHFRELEASPAFSNRGAVAAVLATLPQQVQHDNVQMLLDVFPGAVVWHSLPIWHLERDTQLAATRASAFPNNRNHCIGFFNSQLRCAILGEPSGRIQFLNVWNDMRLRLDELIDQVHHPGRLTEMVLTHLLAMLAPEVLRNRAGGCASRRAFSPVLAQ